MSIAFANSLLSDTTAIALRSVIYNLCRNPVKLEKMLAELDAADRENKLSDPVSFKEAQTHLPYFGAVLKEAMRHDHNWCL